MRTPPLIWLDTVHGPSCINREVYIYKYLPPLSLIHTHTQVARGCSEQSTKTMSFPLTVMSLLIMTTASWAIYGTLIHNIYVQVSVLYLNNIIAGLGNF